MIVSRKCFERLGVEVVAAVDAYEALELFDRTSLLVAVVTDIQLPGMDGIEMMHRMRDKAKEKGISMPVFAVTAYASRDARKMLLENGFDDVFVKPVNYGEIVKVIEKSAERAL